MASSAGTLPDPWGRNRQGRSSGPWRPPAEVVALVEAITALPFSSLRGAAFGGEKSVGSTSLTWT